MTSPKYLAKLKAVKFFVNKTIGETVKLYRGRSKVDEGQIQFLQGTGRGSEHWYKIGKTEFRVSELKNLSVKHKRIVLS